MYNLLLVTTMTFLGSYANMPSCQNAIREIIAQQMNPPGQRLPELEQAIDLKVKFQKTFLCVPVNKP